MFIHDLFYEHMYQLLAVVNFVFQRRHGCVGPGVLKKCLEILYPNDTDSAHYAKVAIMTLIADDSTIKFPDSDADYAIVESIVNCSYKIRLGCSERQLGRLRVNKAPCIHIYRDPAPDPASADASAFMDTPADTNTVIPISSDDSAIINPECMRWTMANCTSGLIE